MNTSLQALVECRPRLNRIVMAGAVLGIGDEITLHAGPPLVDTPIPMPLSTAVVLSKLHYESLATLDEAVRAAQRAEFRPAQDYACVTPLAMPVTEQTPLWEVISHVHGRNIVAYAPVGCVHGPDLRAGKRDIAVIERLKERDQVLIPLLHKALDTDVSIPLLPIAATALNEGDDLHVRTTSATSLFGEVFARHLREQGADESQLQWFHAAMQATPLFFLTIWMAACKCMSLAAEATREGTLVTRIAGNGHTLGIALSGAPDQWITMPGMAPRGPRFPHVPSDATALRAIGDSGVIDAMGFGGMTLTHSPETRAVFADYVNDDTVARCEAMLSVAHPELSTETHTVKVAMDARRVIDSDVEPVVTIAMVDAAATHGLLGRGVVRLPGSLFAHAIASLSRS